MNDSEHHLKYQEFIDEVLQQLYANRTKHKDSHGKGIGYMFCIFMDRIGRLSRALAKKEWDKARSEIAHVAAMLYEVFERVVDRLEKKEKT